jgi:hypothetical protein
VCVWRGRDGVEKNGKMVEMIFIFDRVGQI